MNSNIIKKLTKRLEGSKILPYVKVNSVDEYFNLPKQERERWGLYRKPFALPLDNWPVSGSAIKIQDMKGWSAWEAEIKHRYPVQWFLREWCFSWENPVYAFIKTCYFKYRDKTFTVKCFINPFFPRFRKSMPRHKYADICQVLREVNFALVLDFWYEEMLNGVVNWGDNIQHKTFYKKVKAAVKYIEVDRPALETKLDKQLSVAFTKKKGTYEQRYGKSNAIEKKMVDKDTELLVWVMQNREMFWT